MAVSTTYGRQKGGYTHAFPLVQATDRKQLCTLPEGAVIVEGTSSHLKGVAAYQHYTQHSTRAYLYHLSLKELT